MSMSTWSLTYRQSVFKWHQGKKHFWEFYPQDGGENQLALIWNEITSLSPMNKFVCMYACIQLCSHELIRCAWFSPAVNLKENGVAISQLLYGISRVLQK